MSLPKVLVAEKIGDSGVALLREHFEVEIGVGWSAEELDARIGEYEGILIRSATQLDEPRLARAQRLRVVGRAGVGVDNVDVGAATKRGIVVANAPQSNVITAAEHTMALLLALAEHAGRVMSRDALMDLVKGEQLEAFDRSIDVHVSRIRAVIEDDPKKPRRVITVRGAGYVLAKAQD